MRLEDLGLRDVIDVAEAALMEPHLHGAAKSVEELLAIIEKNIDELEPNRETWGTSTTATAGADAMMALAGGGPAPPREDAGGDRR